MLLGPPSGADPPAHGPHHLADRLAAEIEDQIEAAVTHPAAWLTATRPVRPGTGCRVLPAAERLAEIPGVSLKLARRSSPKPAWTCQVPDRDHLVSCRLSD